ncbi:hypothetical protein LJ753_10985 [Arthrobacter sp. zg-Y20]|uniref:hypothetical protein n=1 Tax=unclassified Arthrobacter TaxID=235627 RepID=UPI001D142443|nr:MULTISPECIES: hypothetical protein [unclassified Arthrobacter]MCC3276394.1 hypothetical protein [Arthrobacter sp. zg-Y20]MDK1316553.1 hypothetical protein [Arthrobacter sp. zg.Y20]WIB06593.1 hypothetical protein QNO06_02285 [Arthrobacter sp. zg-Y20]
MSAASTEAVLGHIRDERALQNTKWGEQNHPDGTGPATRPLLAICSNETDAAALADLATFSTGTASEVGVVTWRDILLEEMFEALAESDPAKLRTELVQVAAVAAQWVEAIDRRTSAGEAQTDE